MKVLVVDDTPAQLYVRARAIAAAGFQVLEATCGRAALEQAANADVLVLDVCLPDIDGLEVCRVLRRRAETAKMPIIHVSAVFLTDPDVGNGTEAGADAYLIDPVPTEVLIQVIESTLGARHP